LHGFLSKKEQEFQRFIMLWQTWTAMEPEELAHNSLFQGSSLECGDETKPFNLN